METTLLFSCINIENILETNNNNNRCIETNIETTLLFSRVNIESI